jgi:hypothetical protein
VAYGSHFLQTCGLCFLLHRSPLNGFNEVVARICFPNRSPRSFEDVSYSYVVNEVAVALAYTAMRGTSLSWLVVVACGGVCGVGAAWNVHTLPPLSMHGAFCVA